MSNPGIKLYVDDIDNYPNKTSYLDNLISFLRVFIGLDEESEDSIVDNVILFNKFHHIVKSFRGDLSHDILIIEFDLRSKNINERKAYFYINGQPLNIAFSGLPLILHFWVLLLLLLCILISFNFIYIYLFHNLFVCLLLFIY